MPTPLLPNNIWSNWNWEPAVLLGTAFGAAVYLRGLRRFWKGAQVERSVRRRHAVAFGGGLVAVLIALGSPLGALSGSLLTAHMVQHMLLTLVAAPLFVLGFPLSIFPLALSPTSRRLLGKWWNQAATLLRIGEMARQPLLAWFANAVLLWVWHLPGVHEAALGNNLVHSVEHLSFFGGGLIFWWTLFQPDEHKRPKFAASILYVLTTALSSTGLGVLMTLTAQPWYPIYSTTASTWGFAPLDDQQLAGLVVWVSSGAIYMIAASALFVLWLDRLERDMRHQAVVSLNSQALPPSHGSTTIEPNCGGTGGQNV